jgi:mannose-6-phosphate isomerase-like protein (cupin superfamily)
MMGRMMALAFALATVFSALGFGQQASGDIDKYFGDWHTSAPRVTQGSLEVHDIFTRGNPLNPPRKDAVFQFLNAYSYATLAPHASTSSARLDGRQEIFFIASGHGTAAAAGETQDLYRNLAILMPASLDFTIKNTGDEPLTMYLIDEPTPAGFRPNPKMLVRDENKIPISSTDGFWCHIVKTLFTTADGLGTLQTILTVTLDPLTVAKPHLVDHEDIEEVWSAVEGNSLAFLGTQLRRQGPGISYLHPPDNKTPHTNINDSEDSQAKFLYFARYHPHQPRP